MNEKYPQWWNHVIDEINAYQVNNLDNLPGAVFGVETKNDGRLISSVGQKWTNDTICEIGSMTKPFISAALLLALEERNMLNIELPICQISGMELYANDPIKSQIRIRDLLQHTSGLPHVYKYTDWITTPCNDPAGRPPNCGNTCLDLGPISEWIGAPALTNECMYADGFCQPARQLNLDKVSFYIMQTYPLISPLGTEYAYSTVNYILAARIIEKLTNKSVNIYIKEKLFTPLEMKNSFFIAQKTGDPEVDAWMDEGVTDEQRARIADITLITKDGQFPPEIASGPANSPDKFRQGWRFVNCDGGMFSTTDDLLNFLVMLRDGGVFKTRRILSLQIVNLLVEDQGHGHTMGFGYRSRVTPYGQSAGTLEHMGFKMTYFWYDPSPENALVGVFLSQRIPNFITNNNMGDGLHVIFKVFLPQVKSNTFGTNICEKIK